MTTRQQVMRFSVVGVTCTVLYMLAFWGLREAGVVSQVANVSSMVATTVLSTMWNRKYTFGVTGRQGVIRHNIQTMIILVVGLAITAATLGLVHHFVGVIDPRIETFLATGANLSATAIRFFGMRYWVFKQN